MNLNELTDEQLEELRRGYEEEVRGVKLKKRAVVAVLNGRATKARLEKKLAGMSDVEQAQLAQVIAAKAAPSGESVGTPGAN